MRKMLRIFSLSSVSLGKLQPRTGHILRGCLRGAAELRGGKERSFLGNPVFSLVRRGDKRWIKPISQWFVAVFCSQPPGFV